MTWAAADARAWADALPVLVGCNYTPAYAQNQIAFWAAETFDPQAIDRELAAAERIGMNALRVYLHDQAWRADPEGFLGRLDLFLALAAGRGHRVLLVLFDDCWHEPVPGPQAAPVPGVHNSRWARSPGRARLLDRSGWGELQDYVRALAARFGEDERVLAWDVYNEPCNVVMPLQLSDARRADVLNPAHPERPQMDAALNLMEAAFGWLRAAETRQPLTAAVYQESEALGVDARLVPLCDVIGFHHYGGQADLRTRIAALSAHGRPLMCTEFMARPQGCTFETHLPVLAEARIPAFCWGLVDGAIQTKFAWTDEAADPPAEPDPWFHDVLRADLSPYDPAEAALIRETVR